jgi:uncharacterized protein YjhX (UPF0386 family)
MKISKILFIAFFGLIGIVMLSFLIPASEESLKKHGVYHGDINFVDVNVSVPEFNHLKVEKDCRLYVYTTKSDSNHFSIKVPADSVPIIPQYHLTGDTLVISSTRAYRYRNINLYCANADSYISSGNIWLETNQDTLKLRADGGRIELLKEQVGSVVKIEARNKSRITCRNENLREVYADLDASQLYVYRSYPDTINVKAYNGSRIQTKQPKVLHCERDRSSRYYESH